ncbi:unnamed protein product [Cuscuta campestris]|uniref:EamA domain-containing protein n=1 Tax=Cuscuta campestris TaxID=132261 RepID=A0A484MN31_9ASTE|nr:unnamed protein product [Cuscuta campestris]
MAAGESMNGGISAGANVEVGDGHLVEMSLLPGSVPADRLPDAVASSTDASIAISDDQVTPLLPKPERTKINIFTITYPKRKSNKEQVVRSESDMSPFMEFITWAWSGSRYSGLLCVTLSSTIYCTMDFLSDIFSGQSISLFEMAFTRCTLLLIFSLVWLKRTGQPIFGLKNVTTLLALRAIVGYFSLSSFIYCIQRLPLSQAVVLSFTTPIMAAVAARFILHEKMKMTEIGGLATSFFGVLFLFQPMANSKGSLPDIGEANDAYVNGNYHIYAVFAGLSSSVAAGISYCLIRAGAKKTDQPVLTVFSFGLFASPAAGICTFAFEVRTLFMSMLLYNNRPGKIPHKLGFGEAECTWNLPLLGSREAVSERSPDSNTKVQNFVLPSCYSLLLMTVFGVLAFFAEITLARGLQLEKTSRAVNILYLEAALSQLLRMGYSRIASLGSIVGCSLILISTSFTMLYCGHD